MDGNTQLRKTKKTHNLHKKMPLVIGVKSIKSKSTLFAHTSLQSSNYTLAITFLKKILKTLSSALPLYLATKTFSPGEINYCIKSFPLRKLLGFDLGIAEVARQLPKKVLTQLIHILNSILRSSYFPL
jgi:hypothetical protein